MSILSYEIFVYLYVWIMWTMFRKQFNTRININALNWMCIHADNGVRTAAYLLRNIVAELIESCDTNVCITCWVRDCGWNTLGKNTYAHTFKCLIYLTYERIERQRAEMTVDLLFTYLVSLTNLYICKILSLGCWHYTIRASRMSMFCFHFCIWV